MADKKVTDPTWNKFLTDLNGLLTDLEGEGEYKEKIADLKKQLLYIETEKKVWKEMYIKATSDKNPEEESLESFLKEMIKNDRR